SPNRKLKEATDRVGDRLRAYAQKFKESKEKDRGKQDVKRSASAGRSDTIEEESTEDIEAERAKSLYDRSSRNHDLMSVSSTDSADLEISAIKPLRKTSNRKGRSGMEESKGKGFSLSVENETFDTEQINEKLSKNDPENEPFWSELFQKDSFPTENKEKKEIRKEKLSDETINQKNKEKENERSIPIEKEKNEKDKKDEKDEKDEKNEKDGKDGKDEKDEKDEKDDMDDKEEVCVEGIRDLPQSLPEALQLASQQMEYLTRQWDTISDEDISEEIRKRLSGQMEKDSSSRPRRPSCDVKPGDHLESPTAEVCSEKMMRSISDSSSGRSSKHSSPGKQKQRRSG
ncbi:glutamic acid-rich protein, partial [Eurytemora carolleeae]|uniref:glutamic acid-rich protein n=1 Tax=Eurytemora carolleeae TaxID=1294199 RepID=UPI000C75A6E0